MHNGELLQQLRATFALELQETVEALSDGVLELETEQPPSHRAAVLDRLFRGAHSLKGAARAVKQSQLADLFHGLESLLAKLRSAGEVSPQVCGLLRACVTAVRAAGDAAVDGAEVQVPQVAEWSQALRAATDDRPFSIPSPIAPERAAEPAVFPVLAATHTRVETQRLDSLLNTGAELLVQRSRLRGGVQQLREAEEALGEWARNYRSLCRQLPEAAASASQQDPIVSQVMLRLHKASSTLQPLLRQLDEVSAGLSSDVAGLERVAGPLEQQIRRVRMVPMSALKSRLQSAFRDALDVVGRQAKLLFEGEEVEADRAVVEGVAEPLMHLLRNAISHGIEPSALRHAVGKPAMGAVRVTVRLVGPQIEIQVQDDGAGIDLDSVRQAAVRCGLPVPEAPSALLRMVLQPQLSTQAEVSQVAGRGVGLDVVRTGIEGLQGSVDLDSVVGRGTTVTLRVPITLTRLRALMMRAGGEVLCVPTNAVIHLLRLPTHEVHRDAHGQSIRFGGQALPLNDLRAVLGLAGHNVHADAQTLQVVLLGDATERAAFVVDEFLREGDIVTKALGPRLIGCPHISGATVLQSGEVALVLQPEAVVQAALRMPQVEQQLPSWRPQPVRGAARILVADDSSTTRQMVTSVLRGQGYRVVSTVNGAEAWAQLQTEAFDLVVADLEMPLLNGLLLTQRIRSSETLSALPVVLISGLDSPEDRSRGLEAGANHYLAKAEFEQGRLLAVVGALL